MRDVLNQILNKVLKQSKIKIMYQCSNQSMGCLKQKLRNLNSDSLLQACYRLILLIQAFLYIFISFKLQKEFLFCVKLNIVN